MYQALFFGSIGTLVETTDMQRRAFNKAFRDAGLDWDWSEKDYLPMLRKSGGRQRIERYANDRGEMVDAAALHSAKVANFAQMMTDEGVSLRPGVRDLIDHAKREGLHLGFVTSTGQDQIDAIFDALGGALTPDEFEYIGNASRVTNGKPSPDIFLDALSSLNLSAANVLAIEDTPICAEAAIAAGITTIGFPNKGVGDTPFPTGVHVISDLKVDLLVSLAEAT